MTQMDNDDEALRSAFSTYCQHCTPGYLPNERSYHFEAFRHFADAVIGDSLRKVWKHLFPKVDKAGHDGLTIGDVKIMPKRAADGSLYECHVSERGIAKFTFRTLHTPGRSSIRSASDTVVLLRTGEQLGITHASISTPVEPDNRWQYRVFDGPGAIPGLVEACDLIRPFIADEVVADKISESADHFSEYLALLYKDGGLPGPMVAKFSQLVLDDGMGAIFDWIASKLPELASDLGDRMTWPDNSLRYNDLDESAVIIRATRSVGIVHFFWPRDEPTYASMQVLRHDEAGKPVHAEVYLIPIGNGELVRAIEAYRAGESIGDHLSMTFDYADRTIKTSAEFLEKERYMNIGTAISSVEFDWQHHRDENLVDGVSRFLEHDGVEEGPISAPVFDPFG